jgi:transcriptional regulator with XRE-family HTH domain
MQRKGTVVIRADEVERLRAKDGLSLEKLAEMVPIDVRTLQRWLAGQPAWFDNVASLAKALDVDFETLTQPRDEYKARGKLQLSLAIPTCDYDECRHLLPIIEFFKRLTQSPYDVYMGQRDGFVTINVIMVAKDIDVMRRMKDRYTIECWSNLYVSHIIYPDGHCEDYPTAY